MNIWQQSVANADLADWLTVAAYIVAAVLCFAASQRAWLRRESTETLFWRATAALMAFLAVNELLDLQSLLTLIGRDAAMRDGWYDTRRTVQLYFIEALAVAAFVIGGALIWLTRTMALSIRTALVGLVFIGAFVLLRAASFHHVDDILTRGSPLFPWGSVQEVAGIAIVAFAAASYDRRTRRRR